MIHAPRIERHEIVRIRGERWRVIGRLDFDASSVLDVEGCDSANTQTRTRFLLPYDRPERLPAAGGPRVVRLRRWRHVARREIADAAPRIDALRAAAKAAIVTIPFQLEPALAVVRGLGSRLLIADEVGLGKTIQAALIVAEVLERTSEGHVLVLCPASLRDQWRQELGQRFGLTTAVLDSACLSDGVANERNPWSAFPVVVASVDYVKRPEVIRALESMVWDAAILDEAHSLSGASERAHAAAAVARRSRLLVMLSATPHSGDQTAFSRLCGLGRLPGDPPLLMFRRTRADAGLPSSRRTHWLRVRISREESDLHRMLLEYVRLVWHQPASAAGARLAMSVLLKRACSSAASLGRSLEKRLLLLSCDDIQAGDVQLALPFDLSSSDDSEPLAVLAARGLSDPAEERRRLDRLLTLAALASRHERKLEILHRILRRTSEPAIIFTEYRDTLHHISAALTGYRTLLLHGGLTAHERREVLRAFAEGPARVLLATDAASEGLNLHHRCRLVVNMELPWTPVRLEQRIGRVDRIGQRRRVHAVHLIAAGTVEERTVARLLRRSALARATLSIGARDRRDRDVAQMMLDGLADSITASTQGDDEIRVADLREDARVEAARIQVARSLNSPPSPRGDTVRPVISVTRRRTSRANAGACYWAFRVDIVDRSGQLFWSTLIGFSAALRPSAFRAARVVRLLMDPNRPDVSHAVRLAHQAALDDLRSRVEAWLTIALKREHGIEAEIERTRARLARRQPGLFDSRVDRAASAQAAILDEARGRSVERLEQLNRLRFPATGPRRLLFAITFE